MADRCEDAIMSDSAPLPSFEQSLAELERLVHELEDGQISLEESLARYERGIGLLKHCYGHLQQAEQRILQLSGIDGDGKPIAQLFEHTATANQAKAEEKKRKLPDEVAPS